MNTASALISCEWLNRHLYDNNTALFDAGFFLPRQNRNAFSEFQQHHIPTAQFFNIDQIADDHSPLPHTVPTALQFSSAVSKLGVSRNTCVIVYDDNAFFASARAWWLFRLFGHDTVKILDGGLSRWLALGYPTTNKAYSMPYHDFIAQTKPELLCHFSSLIKVIGDADFQILDARSPDSFKGERPLNAHDLKPGHIPGSINICYKNLVNPKTATFLPHQQLLAVFKNHGINLNKRLITTCGSGVSAAMLNLALFQLGVGPVALYDGSWAEYGRKTNTKKDLG